MNTEQVLSSVLRYEKLRQRLKDRPQERKKVEKILKEMASVFDPKSVDLMGNLLESTLLKLYEGINFDVPSDLDLAACVREHNVVFVLNHQSHADYLVFNYILYKKYGFSTLIAGGVNLNIFPIGTLFRKCGCFFIRRSFHNDIVYKLTLEGYLSHLLEQDPKPIEFFFEGGRSRTGRLLPPKFGFFHMLLDVHHQLPVEHKKPLVFIPVSLVHELVPEQRTLAREAGGSRKTPENPLQLVKLYKFLNRNFGTIHLKVGHPIEARKSELVSAMVPTDDMRSYTQEVAFECFRAIGKGMVVTPSALLAIVLLDFPTGAIGWEDLRLHARAILDYCERFRIPIAPSLTEWKWEESLLRVISLFLTEQKIRVVQKDHIQKSFYVIEEDRRLEMLFFKNTIIHHFLVPFFIYLSMQGIIRKEIQDVKQLRQFLLMKRRELKYEFYLPTVKDMYAQAIEVANHALGRTITDLQDCFSMTVEEQQNMLSCVGTLACSFRYIYEAYYVVSLTLKNMGERPFTREEFIKMAKEIFEMEKLHGRFVRFPESFTVDAIRSSFQSFTAYKMILREGDRFRASQMSLTEDALTKYAKDLTDLLMANMKLFHPCPVQVQR
jgi:glycerol-3-phosphate O-acyltransferase